MDNHWDDEFSTDEPESGILSSTLRNVGVLALICGVAAFIFSRSGGDIGAPQTRVLQVPEQSQSAAASGGNSYENAGVSEMAIEAGPNGQFFVQAEIDGNAIDFLVDTGASSVALSPQDAEELGLQPGRSEYTLVMNTANGTIRAAPVLLDNISLGALEMRNVHATVQEAELGISLLGMSFLSRLESYEVRGNKLYLAW